MYSIDQGFLSQEQRVGIVTLIPKKGQDRFHLANWRPITLLNSNFKIFSKALSIRIQSCIKDVVHQDQTGFIKGWSITTSLTNIQMVIDQVRNSDSHGILVALHYAKAFDTIRWDLIHKAIKMFRFGDLVSKSVKMLFESIKTCVFNAGYSSGFFYTERGICQGCCCSPGLFVITVELLALMVCHSLDIKGIQSRD